MDEIFPEAGTGTFVGRVWRPDVAGPALVVVRDGRVIDITSIEFPTMRDLLEHDDPAQVTAQADGQDLGSLADMAAHSIEPANVAETLHLLAPCDLQAVKASGVTFARSMVERVIEEEAGGKPELADGIRARITAIIGNSLYDLRPGSAEAERIKSVLTEEGIWSQYLEVGIGPDAEIFTKAQPMSSVG